MKADDDGRSDPEPVSRLAVSQENCLGQISFSVISYRFLRMEWETGSRDNETTDHRHKDQCSIATPLLPRLAKGVEKMYQFRRRFLLWCCTASSTLFYSFLSYPFPPVLDLVASRALVLTIPCGDLPCKYDIQGTASSNRTLRSLSHSKFLVLMMQAQKGASSTDYLLRIAARLTIRSAMKLLSSLISARPCDS